MERLIRNSAIAGFAVLSAFVLSVPVSVFAAGPAAVDLSSAGNFSILSKAGITDTGSHTSVITGNIGSSPITAAAMNNVFCSEMSGTIFGVDAAYVGSGNQTCFAGNSPSSNKTLVDNAVLDMGTAYTDAAGRTSPTAAELGAGNIGGMTLAPGLYKWGTDVLIPTDVTLSGSANDVWIFQIAGNLNVASAGSVSSGVKVTLAGGAKASNIFWQVGGVSGATLGTYSTFSGNILSAKQIMLQTGAVLNGRALAQTQVTLDANTVTAPSVSTPSESVNSNNGNNPVSSTPKITYRIALLNYFADLKAARTAYSASMGKAIADQSNKEKLAARQAYAAALKAAQKTFKDERVGLKNQSANSFSSGYGGWPRRPRFSICGTHARRHSRRMMEFAKIPSDESQAPIGEPASSNPFTFAPFPNPSKRIGIRSHSKRKPSRPSRGW
jgi:hypothetical protein